MGEFVIGKVGYISHRKKNTVNFKGLLFLSFLSRYHRAGISTLWPMTTSKETPQDHKLITL